MGPSAPAAAIAAATGTAVSNKSVTDVEASTAGRSSSVYPGIEGSYAKTKASIPKADRKNEHKMTKKVFFLILWVIGLRVVYTQLSLIIMSAGGKEGSEKGGEKGPAHRLGYWCRRTQFIWTGREAGEEKAGWWKFKQQ